MDQEVGSFALRASVSMPGQGHLRGRVRGGPARGTPVEQAAPAKRPTSHTWRLILRKVWKRVGVDGSTPKLRQKLSLATRNLAGQ